MKIQVTFRSTRMMWFFILLTCFIIVVPLSYLGTILVKESPLWMWQMIFFPLATVFLVDWD